MFPTDSSQFGDVFGRSRVDLTYCRSSGSERSNYHNQCYSSKPNLSENVQHVQTYKLFFNIWNHPIKDVHTCIIVERCHWITAASVTFTGPERWKQNCSLLSNKYAAGTSVKNKKGKSWYWFEGNALERLYCHMWYVYSPSTSVIFAFEFPVWPTAVPRDLWKDVFPNCQAASNDSDLC